VRFGVSDTQVVDIDSDRPGILFTDADGTRREIRCRYLVGADGSRSICRHELPELQRRHFVKEYPFAWFGFLVEAPKSAPELIYNRSDRGFALISQRTQTLQRMYFQVDPSEKVEDWSDDRIWEEMQSRVAGEDGFQLKQGVISDQAVLPFRSFVCEPMRYGSMLLAGDAAHTVPPTGAKGLNLAISDVRILAEVLEQAVLKRDPDVLEQYEPRALGRVWKSQHFSYWMTQMLHTMPGDNDFDARRQVGELSSVVSSVAGSTYLAEGYTGWPGRS
jgi:p-hydroxybenzoate 3-monooxygenase